MKLALVIYNPVSGAHKWQNVPAILQKTLAKHGYDWVWHETKPKEDLKELLSRRYDRIIVAGGDGTVGRAVRALVETKTAAPLVVVPQGSGNLLARALGISLMSTERALKIGLRGKERHLDVICVNKKYYGVVAVGRGYDSFLMNCTSRALKRKFGLFAYGFMFLKTFLFYRPKLYKITLDGKRIQLMARLIFGVNIWPVPFTSVNPTDGLIDLFVMGSRGKIQHLTAKCVVLKARDEFVYQVDGEVVRGKVVSMEMLPKALRVMAPNSD